jgi:aspartate beta-hydroxylase
MMNDPKKLNDQGMVALAADNPTEALRCFKAAAVADSKEPVLWMNVARAQRWLGDYAGEQDALEHALACDKQFFMAWLRKAELHERLNDIRLASLCWRHVLRLAPALSPVPPGLSEIVARAQAAVLQQQGDFAHAMDMGLASDLASLSTSEQRRFHACIDLSLGRRPRVFSNECSGLHFPFLPADEFFETSHFPWIAQLEAKTHIIRAEFETLFAQRHKGFRPYVQMEAGLPDTIWTSLDGSMDWSALFLWEYGKPIEPAFSQCPQTVAALEAIPRMDIAGRAPTVFFSLLRPHTHIPAHTGVTNTRTIIHLPLIVPEHCRFRVGGETRQWQEGKAFAFDDTIEHEAWNDSDALRVVLIFDVWNPHLTLTERQLLRRYFEIADAVGRDVQSRGEF